MTIRPILSLPDPRLRTVSKPVAEVNDALRALVGDMFDTMYEAPGIGLAAIQIGVGVRILVIDTAKKDAAPEPLVCINPQIIGVSDELSTYEEGCLSIPDYYEEVKRPESVRVRFLDRDGKLQELEASGVLATCLQHEIDHLNGVLFIDHISKLKRARVIKKFIKIAKRDAENKDAE